jgi:lipopolysaccharide export system protein LptC
LSHAISASAGSAQFSARNQSATDRAYRAARRHSRFVRVQRFCVLASIAGLLITVVAANLMSQVGDFQLPAEISKLLIKGSKITMQQPRLAGFTNDSRPYTFTADAAAQDLSNPDFLELRAPKAKMQLSDASTVNMSANSGTYSLKTEMLTLTDDIYLVTSTGYEARLSTATIDIRKGNVVSDQPVWVKLTNGIVNAHRLEVFDSGALIRFGGGVSMVVTPESSASKASQP